MLLSPPNFIFNPSPPPTKPHLSPFPPIPQSLISIIPKHPSLIVRCSNSNSPATPHSAIKRIADKLRSLGFTERNPEPQTANSADTKHPQGEIFIPLPHQLSKYRVGHTLDPSWSTPENPVPRPGSGNAIARYHGLREVVKKEREAKKREPKVPTLAELTLSEEELRRLRRIGIAEKKKLKVGKAGITEGIVNGIHERWRRVEVVKIVCEDLCRMNMKRTRDLLERKTGGLVVWSSGSKVVLYRGVNYKYPYFMLDNAPKNDASTDTQQDINEQFEGHKTATLSSGADCKAVRPSLVQGVGVPNRVRFQLPGEVQLAEEVDNLLEGLGPRFNDWWGYEPLPVDADLLPAIVPGYQKPFRLLPYGVKPILTNDEMTTLKRLGRPLPCHFALGRNRKLQGLAASILKLWEKSEIAKIAIKRGVQNTNSEMMAEELKWLTGGILLSRDKEFIVLYRGKDFLPSAVSSAIKERKTHAYNTVKDRRDHSISAKTAKETEEDDAGDSGSRDEFSGDNDQGYDLSKQRKLISVKEAIKRTSIRLSMALEKKAQAEKLLAELENSEMTKRPGIDKEGITEEERHMLRKVGLRMKPFLLTGRRGVFDGTIENMHLHWKYRELVKIICKEKSLEAAHEMARTLEAESGGILVAVERVSKGYAIVVYRGKNYQRPPHLRPQTLLNKREALKRFVESQRHKSLKLHVLRLTRNVDELKLKLAKDEEEAHNMQSFDQVNEEASDMDSAMHGRADSELSSDSHSFSATPSHCNEHSEVFDGHEIGKTDTDSLSGEVIEESHASVNKQPSEQSNQTDPSLLFGRTATGRSEPQSSESVSEEPHANLFPTVNDEAADSASFPDAFTSEKEGFSPLVSSEDCASQVERMGSTVESTGSAITESLSSPAKKETGMPSRVIHLSNRDRLMLRKQALKMKKRPVLSVGRSNIVTGVAKAIKEHFKKYPLAIVNVKGRAKGTSIQEVVFQLEQATGGVLVSHEPSKVILYRGWGAFEEPVRKGSAQDVGQTSVGEEGRSRITVSPDLIAAIRFECDLQNKQGLK